MFGLGPWEIAVIVGAVLLVAGPALLPRLGRYVGKTVTGLRESAEGFGTNLRDEMNRGPEDRERLLLGSVDESASKSSEPSEEQTHVTTA